MNSSTITLKAKQFFNQNYGWILLITGVIMLVFINGAECIKDFIIGFNEGLNGLPEGSLKVTSKENIAYSFSSILFTIGLSSVALLIFSICIVVIGNFFYYLFFKYILQKSSPLYIAAFVVWFFVFYNLTWKMWASTFKETNAFTSHFEALKILISKEKLATFVIDYQENYATLNTAITFMVIIAYVFIKNYVINTKTQAKLIAEKSQAELTALKAQINPHFLFNVLNNLYGTSIVEDSPKTSEGILQLSSIMRHVVEGTKNEKIDLEKEIRFMNDYIDLSKIRVPKRPNISIVTNIDWDESPTTIAPLLVIPYIENAFKYGISINETSFIEMNYTVSNKQLEFSCRNSIIKLIDKLEIGTGTGLENTKRRLDLYYPDNYELLTDSSEGVFSVSLKVILD